MKPSQRSNIIINLKSWIRKYLYKTNIIVFEHDENKNKVYELKCDVVEIKKINDLRLMKFTDEVKKNISKIEYFLSQNVKVFLAKDNKKVIGHYLVTRLSDFKPYPYLNSKAFDKKDFYIFFCRTSNSYRGQSIYPSMLNKIIKTCQPNNRVMISTDINNLSAIRGIEKGGFRKKGTLYYRNLLSYFNKEVFILQK